MRGSSGAYYDIKTFFIMMIFFISASAAIAQTQPASSMPGNTAPGSLKGANSLLELPSPNAPSSFPAAVNAPGIPNNAPVTSGAPIPSPPPATENASRAESPSPETPPPLSPLAKSILDRNGDILFEPMRLGDTSIIFNKNDMEKIINALKIYDKKVGADITTVNKDSLSSLLDSLGNHEDSAGVTEAPPVLPNLYLGSIVYYSASNWSVWINDKKLTDKNNKSSNELYITRISRTEAELLWKPYSLLDLPVHWQILTQNGAHPLPGISVDEHTGIITLQLHPNQTFLPRSLTIHEGLIKSSRAAFTATAPPSPIVQKPPSLPTPTIPLPTEYKKMPHP